MPRRRHDFLQVSDHQQYSYKRQHYYYSYFLQFYKHSNVKLHIGLYRYVVSYVVPFGTFASHLQPKCTPLTTLLIYKVTFYNIDLNTPHIYLLLFEKGMN